MERVRRWLNSIRRREPGAEGQLSSDLYHLFRISALGATAVLPLQGAASVEAELTPRRAVGLLGVALGCHGFIYLHNDLCDLALDRSQPLRAQYPLVRGALAPSTAGLLALACLGAALGLDALVTAPQRAGARRSYLAAGLGLLAIYNQWGKRCPFPPLTDLIQGLGWAALIRYGAAATGHAPRDLTDGLAAYELGLIMLVNGVHGALRDLGNDAACGATTTARLLGARVDAEGRLHGTVALAAYAVSLQTLLLGVLGWTALRPAVGAAARVAGGLLALLTLAGLVRGMYRPAPPQLIGMLHLILILSAPLALVVPQLRSDTALVVLGAHLGPLLLNRMSYEAVAWALGWGNAPCG